jgi:hypothetical protein
MVTYNELETWVCGKNKKTEVLTEDNRRIKWFWEVLREFSEEDK